MAVVGAGNCSQVITKIIAAGFNCGVDPFCPFDFNGDTGEDCLKCDQGDGTGGLQGFTCKGCEIFFPAEGGATQIVCKGNPNTCFDKDTSFACRVADPAATPAAVFDACYQADPAARPELAERVRMGELAAGDVVLTGATDGTLAFTRVLVNEKRAVDVSAEVLSLETASGARLSLTHDHALYVDGTLQPASAAAVGAALHLADAQPTRVTRVTRRMAHVVNPITLSGTILAGEKGAPVLAATGLMWIAPFMIESRLYKYLLPLSPSRAASYAMPAAAQAYYDSVLEPVFSALTAGADKPLPQMPHAVLVPMLAVFDVTIAAGFVIYSLANLIASLAKTLITLALLVLGCRALRGRRASARAA